MKLPVRTFTVTVYLNRDSVNIEGHAMIINENGDLSIQRLSGGLPWVIAAYASGAWMEVQASLPAEEDVRAALEGLTGQSRIDQFDLSNNSTPGRKSH